MTKAEARKQINGMGLPAKQAHEARKTIRRATNSEDIGIQASASGEIVLTRTRPGHDGYQVFEDVIMSDGTKKTVQKAYDAAGNLVHYDPKGGT